MLKSRLLPALVAMSLTVAAHSALAAEQTQKTPGAAEADSMIAAISGAAGKLGRQANLPAFLSESDASAYRAAFEAQDAGQWSTADRQIEHIHDPLLMGHLLAQRYLSGAVAVQPEELRDWMNHHADLPEADDIYELAKHRLGARAASLKLPSHPAQAQTAGARDGDVVWEDFSVQPGRNLSAAERRSLTKLKDHFRDLVSDRHFDDAEAMLDGGEMRRVFDKADYDELKTVLAQAYFADGHDAEAVRWAADAAERSGDVLPQAHWVAGLALWRSGKHAQSAHHFEAVGNSAQASAWLAAAGAYWASRANLAGRHPEVVNHWLNQAAAHPRTFYGMLARKALGQDVQYSWDSRPFTDQDAETLASVPAARRAAALLQLGDRGRAEEELRHLSPSATPALAQSMLSLANAGGLPEMTVRLSAQLSAQDGRQRDVAAYPVPEWRPNSGWSVDRALVLAIARQESGFNPHAKSPAGAVGLMQLMPMTAKSMGASGKLTDPTLNLDLGQRYVRHLLDDDSIKGNLLFLAASYNSGPGAVARWSQGIHHNGDALMFMESIPARETRAFVERVMTNFWAYRNRLGQDSPSLEAIAAGDWPMYDGSESKVVAVRNVRN